MGYPEPGAEDFTQEDPSNRARFLVNTSGVRGAFLGSLLELSRYGNCWYLVDASPRESDFPSATFGFVYRENTPHLLIASGPDGYVPGGRVGYGTWESEFIPELRSMVLDMPGVDRDATGHVIYLDQETRLEANDVGLVSERVGVDTFGTIPPAPSGAPARPLEGAELPELCASVAYWARTPEGVVRRLLRDGLDNWFLEAGGFGPYEPPRFRHLDGDHWRIVADRAVLDVTIEHADRCARLVSIDTIDRDPPLRRVWIEPSGATIGVDWGGGDDAFVELSSGSTGAGGMFKQIREQVTLPWSEGRPAGTVSALTVLYKDEQIVSVSFDLYPVSGG
jgi:hypothetical protein